MAEKIFRNIIFVFLIFILVYACGGGGGGGGEGPGTGTGPASGVYLFYYDKNGGLYAVDPDDPLNPITVEPSGVKEPMYIIAGTWDTVNHEIKNLYTRYVLYAKGGKLYKVSALKSENLGRWQVSSESEAVNICDTHTHFDWNNPENSFLYYTLAGPDSSCNSADDVRRMVRIGMGSGEQPIDFPSGIYIVHELIERSDGSITAWLAHDTANKKLKRCDKNMSNCTDVTTTLTNIERAKHLASDWSSDIEALWVYTGTKTWVGTYDNSNNTITAYLDFTGNEIIDYEKDSGSVYICYRESGNIRVERVRFSDAWPKTLLTTTAQIDDIALTDSRVIYLYQALGNYYIWSMRKDTGGDRIQIIEKTYIFELLVTKGNKVFYEGADVNGSFAGYVLDDGSESYEVQNSLWSFFIFSSKITNNDSRIPSVSRVVRLDNCSINVPYCAGGTMSSFDASTYSSSSTGITIGTVPSDIYAVGVEYPYGFGNNILGIGFGASQTDIFFFKPDTANSLRRITDTPLLDEYPVFF